MDVAEGQLGLRRLRRPALYAVGALAVVTVIAVWMNSAATSLDAAEADGDTDLRGLATLFFLVSSVGALAVYGLAMTLLERALRRREQADAVDTTLPDRVRVPLELGGILGFVWAIAVGTGIGEAGGWVPPALAVLLGVGLARTQRFRVIGIAWSVGISASTAAGWYLSFLVSMATGV